jgi:hypothetical protein
MASKTGRYRLQSVVVVQQIIVSSSSLIIVPVQNAILIFFGARDSAITRWSCRVFF